MYLTVYVLLLTVFVSNSSCIDYIDCGSSLTVRNLTLEHCYRENICPLYIGEDPLISFTVNNGINNIDSKLENEVSILIGSVRFPLSVTPETPCEILPCPLPQNYASQYTAKVHIDKRFDQVYAHFEWIMKTTYKANILCFQFPVVLYRTRL